MSDIRFSAVPATALNDARVTATHTHVLATLGLFADRKGFAHPSQGTLSEAARVSRQTVSKCLKELCEFGHLEIKSVTLPGRGKVGCEYRILFDVGRAEPDQPPVKADVKPALQRGKNINENSQCKPCFTTGADVNEALQRADVKHGLQRVEKPNEFSRCKAQFTTGAVVKHGLHPNEEHHPSSFHSEGLHVEGSGDFFSNEPLPVVEAEIVSAPNQTPSKKSQPDRQRFAMTEHWTPPATAADFARNKLNFQNDQYADALAEFREYWTDQASTKKGKKTNDGWNRTFRASLRTLASRWGTTRGKASGYQRSGDVIETARRQVERGLPSGDGYMF